MTTLYFSQYGNDSNDGLSQEKPKKDITKYSNVDNVCLKLKAGEEFVFDSYIKNFYVGQNVEICAYEEGKMPIISGYIEAVVEWNNEMENIYYCSLEWYQQSTYTDNKRINIGSIRITSAELGISNISFNRVYEKSLLVAEEDFYIDYEKNRLYVYTRYNPEVVKYELARTGACLSMQRSKPNVYIHDVEICGFSRHGINGSAKNATISKCYICNIGGEQVYPNEIEVNGWERMGNGIEIWGDGSENVLVKDNIIETCFDAGITIQASSGCKSGANEIEFKNNIVKNCYYLFELYNTNRENAFLNIKVHDNTLLYCNSIGYRQKYYSCSQLCIWNQNYENGGIQVYDNIFAYTNKYTCYSAAAPDKVYCTIYDNVFMTDSINVNQYGSDLIDANNRIYSLDQTCDNLVNELLNIICNKVQGIMNLKE